MRTRSQTRKAQTRKAQTPRPGAPKFKLAGPNVTIRRGRSRPAPSLGSTSFSPRELGGLPLEYYPEAPVRVSELRRELSARKERAIERRRREAAARKIAARFGRRVRRVLGEVGVPRSLRSRRAWSLREWSEHPASSPPEVERTDLLLFTNARKLFVRELARALQDQVKAAGVDGAGAGAGGAVALGSPNALLLRRAYGVMVTSGGAFRGENKGAAEEAMRQAGPEARRLGARQIGAALDRALAKLDERANMLTSQKGYTLWESRQQRRRSVGASKFTGGQFMTVAAGRRSRRVVGKSLLPYQLPEDLRAWLESIGVRYDPALNPRLRQRVRGLGTRARFVWGYNQGLGASKAQTFVDLLRAGATRQSAVSPRRNWAALHPAVMELRVSRSTDPAPSATKLMTDVLTRLDKQLAGSQRAAATAIFVNFQTRGGAGHASLLVVGLRKAPGGRRRQLLLRILDPHASDSLVTSATRAVLTRVATEAASRAKVVLDERPTLEACTFRPAKKQRAMRVQYGKEGVCGPSSFALLLSALRQLRSPARLWQAQFCDRTYGGLRIQDAVLVMQIIRRL